MNSSEKFVTRAKIVAENLTLEFEGTEAFVTACLEQYRDKILEAVSTEDGHGAVAPERKSTERHENTRNTKSNRKKGPSSSSKSTKISAERFDIHGNGNTQSLDDFLAEKSPGRSNSEKIVTIGYYISELLGEGQFAEGQIEYAYKMLKYKRPTHLHQIMINAKNDKDWFEQTDEAGTWKLTRSGDIFVSDELPRDEL